MHSRYILASGVYPNQNSDIVEDSSLYVVFWILFVCFGVFLVGSRNFPENPHGGSQRFRNPGRFHRPEEHFPL